MTEQIKSAMQMLINATYSDEWQGNEELTKAQHLAINSLQAWEEVLTELRSAKVNNIPCDSAEEAIGIGKGLTYVIEIINQHLAEIEE